MAATSDMTLLTTFQHHIDDMRNLVMCKICLKPLYEPFILACGHTYCYGCLRSWFSGLDSRRRKKNCPDCRAEVKSTPSANYILRDLVHMFIGRAELLPEDETVDEHAAGKKVEADLLASDKDDKGLFQGAFFRRPIHPLMAHLGPITDYEDGVERCPMCAWEIEDGMCNHCGYEPDEDYEPWSDDEENMSMMGGEQSIASDDISEGTGYDSENDVPPHFYGARSVADEVDHSVSTGTDPYSDPGYETPYAYDEDEEDMDGFIDDNDGDEPDEVDEDDMSEAPVRYVPRPRSHLYRIPDDDEDSSGEEEEISMMPGHLGYANNYNSLTDSEESDGDDQIGEDQDQHTNYDESDEESRSSTPIAIPVVSRRRPPIVISDSDDDEEEGDEGEEDQEHDHAQDQDSDEDGNNDIESRTEGRSQSETVEDEGNESSSSDDTAILRQSLAFERQRVDNDRKRRRSPDAWRAIARPRRDDYSERNTSQYRTPYRRQSRPTQTPVNLST